MKRTMRFLRLGMFGALLLTAGTMLAHDPLVVKPSFKISDDGVLKLTEDVAIRESTLKKGMYVIEHRVDRNLHVLTFIRIGANHVVEDRKEIVASSVMPVSAARHSIVDAVEEKDGVVRIQTIQLAWENALHSL